jgi:hypothetical protein
VQLVRARHAPACTPSSHGSQQKDSAMKHNLTTLLMVCALGLSSGLQAEMVLVEDDALMMNDALSEEDLSGERGEGTLLIDDIWVTHADLDGTSMGNSVANSITGNNYIGSTAFNGANGMIGVIQNTGNNVVIQKSTIVNISLE